MVAKETNHHVIITKSFLAINRVIRATTKSNCKVVVALITRLIARKDMVVVT